jgi:hypothetical protein
VTCILYTGPNLPKHLHLANKKWSYVPKVSGFVVGDRVPTKYTVTFGHGFVLGKGWVVGVDDDGQAFLPLYFVQGVETRSLFHGKTVIGKNFY